MTRCNSPERKGRRKRSGSILRKSKGENGNSRGQEGVTAETVGDDLEPLSWKLSVFVPSLGMAALRDDERTRDSAVQRGQNGLVRASELRKVPVRGLLWSSDPPG